MFAPIAQLVEQIPLKDKVPGSIPGGRTNFRNLNCFRFLKFVRSGGKSRAKASDTELGSQKSSSDGERIICDHKYLTDEAEVAKLVDALALGASGATHGGSSPLLGTSTQ